MELYRPEQIALDETSKALLEDVEETARRVNDYRPLPPHVIAGIEDELLGERVYASNAIEGNTLDLRETVAVIKQRILIEKKKREAQEALNLGDAVKRVAELVRSDEPCHHIDRLLEVHGLVLRGQEQDHPGRFRPRGVMIAGAKYQPPDHSMVRPLVGRVLETLSNPPDCASVLLAAWAHWAVAAIHPFCDGNGRTARLWQDLILFKARLTASIIRPEDRRLYFDALDAACAGAFDSLVRLVAQRILATFDRYLIKLREDEELTRFAREISVEASAGRESRSAEYLQWKRRMEQLRFEFELCAAKVSEQPGDLKIQVDARPVPDQPTWENLSSGLTRESVLFFVLTVSRGPSRSTFVFLFARHAWTNLDTQHDRSRQRVGLIVGYGDGTGIVKSLDAAPGCAVTLREIFLGEDGWVRKRYHSASGNIVYDRDVAPAVLAKDFVREAVLGQPG